MAFFSKNAQRVAALVGNSLYGFVESYRTESPADPLVVDRLRAGASPTLHNLVSNPRRSAPTVCSSSARNGTAHLGRWRRSHVLSDGWDKTSFRANSADATRTARIRSCRAGREARIKKIPVWSLADSPGTCSSWSVAAPWGWGRDDACPEDCRAPNSTCVETVKNAKKNPSSQINFYSSSYKKLRIGKWLAFTKFGPKTFTWRQDI